MAIKSGWDCFGLEAARPTRNVVLRNLTIHSPTSAGVCIGSEMSGGVANVRATDLVLRDVATGLRIKASRGRGAYVRNISYSNVSIEGFITHAIQVSDFYGQRNPSCGDRNASATRGAAGGRRPRPEDNKARCWGHTGRTCISLLQGPPSPRHRLVQAISMNPNSQNYLRTTGSPGSRSHARRTHTCGVT